MNHPAECARFYGDVCLPCDVKNMGQCDDAL